MFHFILLFACCIFSILQASTSLTELDRNYQIASQKSHSSSSSPEPIEGTLNSYKIRNPSFLKDQDKVQHLFHALNAGLNSLSSILETLKNDKVNDYQWTYENYPVYIKKGNNTTIKIKNNALMKERLLSPENVEINFSIHSNLLYEISSQIYAFNTISLWKLFAFWKKNIFIDNDIDSFNGLNACALYSQINDTLTSYQDLIINPPPSLDIPPYTFTTIALLENVVNAIPQEIYLHHVNKNLKQREQYKQKKSEENLEIIKKRWQKYNTNYTAFWEKYNYLNAILIFYSNNYLQTILDPAELKNKFLQAYKEFNRHSFPLFNDKRKNLWIHVTSLHFNDLLSNLDRYIISEFTPPNSDSQEISHQPENTKIETFPSEEGDEAIYDTNYWKKENEYHTLRKSVKQLMTETSASNESQTYKKDLSWYLAENIFKYKKLKRDTLIQELRDIGFYVEQNTAGKGSVYHVGPLPTNPLFCKDAHYKEAYFNIHLPHKNENIPPVYFKFLQSGFENVFGLEIDR